MTSTPYIPRRGERVRIAKVCPQDVNPASEEGDIIEVEFACLAEASNTTHIPPGEWVLVRSVDHKPGVSTWCQVEPLPPLDWAPPSERPTGAPGPDDDGATRACAIFAEAEQDSWAHQATAFVRANHGTSFPPFEQHLTEAGRHAYLDPDFGFDPLDAED